MPDPSVRPTAVPAPRDPSGLPADVPETTSFTEVIYSSDRTVVTREVVDGGTVIVKQALGPSAVKRTEHERAILRRLDGLAGVPRLRPGGPADTLMTEDLGGTSLAEMLEHGTGGLDRGEAAWTLAHGLADVLASIHRAGVIHRDLNPANVLVCEDEAGRFRPVVIDFDLATTFAQIRPAFVDTQAIVGRLPYLAPEQTGRTGLPIDVRTDLYALGATLYEVVTGAVPFRDDDVLRVIADILAKEPVPAHLVSAVPERLSRILSRLLMKDPGARYQSAEGLAHDLGGDRLDDGELGVRDFPSVLSAPTRLIGREPELHLLTEALETAGRLGAGAQCLLVSGPPGAGKSALIGQLRPLVTARGGWFVSGKADQFQQDAKASVFAQAMDAMGQLILAMPDAELRPVRQRIQATLGENAGLIAGLVPSLQVLLGVAVESRGTGDPATTRARITRTAPDLIRGAVSSTRPLVLFLDDIQWAGPRGMDTIDALLAAAGLDGLLLVVAFREEEIDAVHPLAVMMNRWDRLGRPARRLRLANLAPEGTGRLVAEMLRLPVGECAPLASLLIERTGGNPYETMEFVNTLRRDGVLALGVDGWTWDPATVHRHLGSGNLIHLLTKRLTDLPAETVRLLRAMACLGTEVEVSTLVLIGQATVEATVERLVPALEDGLIVSVDTSGSGTIEASSTVMFAHDRVQQAAHDSLAPAERAELILRLARALAGNGKDLDAAQQYLEVAGDLVDVTEQRQVVRLFQGAAEAARRRINPLLVERYAAAATELHERSGGLATDPTGVTLDEARHGALYDLGRLEDADAVFARIQQADPDALELAPAACIQMSSLTNRGRPGEALELGVALLHRLGLHYSPDTVADEVREGYAQAEVWLGEVRVEDDVSRPELTDDRVRAAATLLTRMCPTAFFADHQLLGWLVSQARQLWIEYGPHPDLLPGLGHSNSWSLGLRPTGELDRRTIQHALAVGRARHYDVSSAHVYFVYAVVLAAAFEPIDEIITETRSARETLLRHGDLQTAGYAYYVTVFNLIDTAQSLDVLESENEAALALAIRLSNHLSRGTFLVVRQFIEAMRGESDSQARAGLNEAVAGNSNGLGQLHFLGALQDAILGDHHGLSENCVALRPLLRYLAGTYPGTIADLLLGLDAARRYESVPGHRDEALQQLEDCRARLSRAASRAPANYRHLVALLDAERAALVSDPLSVLIAYDTAVDRANQAGRPWHQALAYERAGRAHLRLGLRHTALSLLGQARLGYLNWGAIAKVRELDREHPSLRLTGGSSQTVSQTSSTGLSAHTLDMMAILRASQAISSQTDPDALNSVLSEQLRTLTGAVTVQIVLPAENGDWLLQPDALGAPGVPVEQAGALKHVALSVFRYVERRREPLVVADALSDDRFGADGFFAGLAHCSLFAVPIVRGGVLRAVLIMTNPRSRGAFGSEGLDAVQLIAGQLAITLDNALLYQSLEAKVLARTNDLEVARSQLETLSLTDALTQTGNRRRFDVALRDEWTASADTPLTVIMIDIDHFKGYNDLNGHVAGDVCLRSVALALGEGLRKGDLICRYGGEEFAVILPDTPAEPAWAVAERLRQNVTDLALAHPGGGIVTVSVGVATRFRADDASPQALVAVADGALYRAKEGGRNRVEVAR